MSVTMGRSALAEFILARLAEQEADALQRRGIWPSPGVKGDGAVWLHIKRGGNAVVVEYLHPVEGYGDMADLLNWADTESGWTANRSLADVAAKRAIVKECMHVLDYEDYGWHLAEAVLRQLASAWASHPDYMEAWKP